MSYIELESVEEKELIPGYKVRFVHSEYMTFAYWTIEAGATLPEHSHHHEQVGNVLEGEFELTVGGEVRALRSGMVAIVPPNVPHSGVAITNCRILDVFYPIREDYR